LLSHTPSPLMETRRSPSEGLSPMLSSESAPSSPRPWASARARPLANDHTLTRTFRPSGRKGTFLLCRDTGPNHD
jgi:hypothetical protein